MYQQTSKGYKFVEADDDYWPEMRRHCARCGAFLTETPTEISPEYRVVLDFDPVFKHNAPRLATPEEAARGEGWNEGGEPYWTCRRCDYSHGSDEMFS